MTYMTYRQIRINDTEASSPETTVVTFSQSRQRERKHSLNLQDHSVLDAETAIKTRLKPGPSWVSNGWHFYAVIDVSAKAKPSDSLGPSGAQNAYVMDKADCHILQIENRDADLIDIIANYVTSVGSYSREDD